MPNKMLKLRNASLTEILSRFYWGFGVLTGFLAGLLAASENCSVLLRCTF